MYNIKEFEELEKIINPKGYRSAMTTSISLINKLNEKGIEDNKLKDMFSELLNAIIEYRDGCGGKKKINSIYSRIINYVKDQYNMEQRGSIQGAFLAIFMGAGVAIGTALSSSNSAFMALGLALGAGLGVSIGSSKEKKAEQENRLY